MLKRVLLAMLAIPIVMIGSVAATAEDAGQPSGWSLPEIKHDIKQWLGLDTGGVRVPVVLDGVKLSAEEFNALDRKLNGQAAIAFVHWYSTDSNPTATALKGGRPIGVTLFAFSTREGRDAFLAARGIPPLERPTEGSGECRLLPDGSAICGPRDQSADFQQPNGSAIGAQSRGDDVRVLQGCQPNDPSWSRNYEHLNCGGAQL